METFSKQALKDLTDYEPYFSTAVYQSYVRFPGRNNLLTIKNIAEQSLGRKIPLVNDACGNCVYRFIREMGEIYFRSKEQYQNASNASNLRKTPTNRQK